MVTVFSTSILKAWYQLNVVGAALNLLCVPMAAQFAGPARNSLQKERVAPLLHSV